MIGPGGAAGALALGRNRFSAKVDVAAGVSPIFTDDFETVHTTGQAPSPNTQNGYSWGGTVTSTGGAVEVSTDRARNGTRSLKILHPGQADCADSKDAMDFKFNGAQLTEVWVEYYIWIPADYDHRDQGTPCGTSDNNKFFQLWADERSSSDKLWIGIELNEELDHDSSFRGVRDNNFDIARTITGELINDMITDTERGQWNRLQVHAKVGTFDNNDGVFQVMWNGATYLDRTDLDYYKDPNGGLGAANYIDNGRIMGWANSGFDADTAFYIDDFSIYDSDPGWVF